MRQDGTTKRRKFVRLFLLGSLLRGLGDLSSLLGLLDAFNDTDSNRLPHVTDGEATKRWVLVVCLDAHRLARDELDDRGISRLDELGRSLHRLTRSAIDLLEEFGELACNMSGVAIQNR